MNAKVFVTRVIPESGLSLLRTHCGRVEVFRHDRPVSRAELKAGARDADGLLCLLSDPVRNDVIESSHRLRVISNYGVGVDNIDIPAATARGIAVTNTPGVLTQTTAELACALIFALARRIVESDRFTRAGGFIGWGPLLMLGRDIHGKTLGIVGAGRIGHAVGVRAAGLGMKVLYRDTERRSDFERKTKAKRVGLRALLRKSDFVTLHVPLTGETACLIGAKELALMKPSAYLVNTARGPVVDEAALVEALKIGRLAGAGFDVYEHEPRIHPGLLKLENVVLLPHIGSATIETRNKMAEMAAMNLIDVLRGRMPESLVNPAVWRRRRR